MWRKNHAYIPHQNFWQWWWWFKNWYLGRALFIRFSLATGQAMTWVWRCWWPNLRSRWLAPPNADRYKTNPNWCWPIQIWCWLNHAYYINTDFTTVRKCPWDGFYGLFDLLLFTTSFCDNWAFDYLSASDSQTRNIQGASKKTSFLWKLGVANIPADNGKTTITLLDKCWWLIL